MPQFSRRDLTLLIIEDEEHVAKYLTTVLKNLFKTIEAVPSLKDGEQRLAANHVDAVLLDLNLTNGAGLGPVQRLRGQYPYLPIIVMTGGSTPADDCMSAGACDFLHKGSMSPHDVFDAVVKSVSRREAFRKLAEFDAASAHLGTAIEEGKAKLQERVAAAK
ncbi:MAG: response regulator [Patescibacteria group bacterium]|nr:response regulator [Patescibacteria group bacterium]